ncbi:nucleotidase [Holotrichia oblita]|uniref:Nucleotidase n=1 Tax=Holotrichia oblita TaxID=644536 RepID=A0ACB9T7G4_HOLOL|nr:nucleotidase [Holotrichia oblita]
MITKLVVFRHVYYAVLGYRAFCTMVIMNKDYVNTLKELTASNVYIKDKTKVNEIINELAKAGINKLQVILDFDRTVTKQHVNGVRQYSSFGIFEKCPSLPASYLSAVTHLNEKYMPIEFNPLVPRAEKKKHMEDWWRLSEETLIGLTVSQTEIDEVVKEIQPPLRDGCPEFFSSITKENVPILIFSAGLGQTVVSVLKYHGILNEKVKVVANFLKYDENGVIQGFRDNIIINVFNKNESVLRGTEYYERIKDRTNAIVVGDSLGDASMFDCVAHKASVLKIGFLYDHVSDIYFVKIVTTLKKKHWTI